MKILEKHVQETCVEFLKLDGWRPFRTELTVQRERGRVVGERGQPDYLFLRYTPKAMPYGAEILWIEFKRPGGTRKPDQVKWHAAEQALGARIEVVSDIDYFMYWYRQSGLMRRKI